MRARRVQVFNDENLYLYKIIPPIGLERSILFKLGDNLHTKGDVFRVCRRLTVVTKDRIVISSIVRTITFILNENDNTFALYQRLLPLEDFTVSTY